MIVLLIRFLFWLFLIFCMILIFAAILFPVLLKRYVRKKQSQFNHQFNQQQDPVEKEGNVSIKTKPNKSKTDTNDIGEYVDFEEVDE